MDYQKSYERWRACVSDEGLSAELEQMKADADAIEDAFYKTLEFGTAGLRGVLGAGTNRMNIHTVGQATQGIADFIKESAASGSSLPPCVAICYDCRINSELFARTAAGVLAANGIKTYVFPRLEPTPLLSFATRELNCGIGINVTASHNPAKYNGYKVYGPDGCQIASDIADAITNAISKVDVFDDVRFGDFDRFLNDGLIEYVPESLIDDFIKACLKQDVAPASSKQDPLKLVYTPLNGTGLETVGRIFEELNITDVHVVPEQAQPDGNFPTCPSPNPESRDALELGIRLCEEVHPDLLLATDPDTDRVGVAVEDEGDYQLISGNEMGVLLLDYLCRMRTDLGTMPSDPVAVTTIVSTSLADQVAEHYGVEMRRCLTGFKYIGGIIAELEAAGHPERFVFGFEESYGYLAGTHARDKDAVVASMLICQMARYYRRLGKTLYAAMQDIYAQYGFHRNRTLSFTFEGVSGSQKMKELMSFFRNDAPSSIAGLSVEGVLDYQLGINGLPSANVIEFDLEGGNKAIVRPSGTEPKIKIYVFSVGENAIIADKLNQRIGDAMAAYME